MDAPASTSKCGLCYWFISSLAISYLVSHFSNTHANILIIENDELYDDGYYENSYDDAYDRDDFYSDTTYDRSVSPNAVFDMIEDNVIYDNTDNDGAIYFQDGFHTN